MTVFAFPPIGPSSASSQFDRFVAALVLSNKSIEPERLYMVSHDLVKNIDTTNSDPES